MPKKNEPNLRTGDEVIKFAKGRGAEVTPNAHGRHSAIETPSGKMHILPGKETLDKQTQGNVKRWLKLLGLLSLLMVAVDFLWGYFGLPSLF